GANDPVELRRIHEYVRDNQNTRGARLFQRDLERRLELIETVSPPDSQLILSAQRPPEKNNPNWRWSAPGRRDDDATCPNRNLRMAEGRRPPWPIVTPGALAAFFAFATAMAAIVAITMLAPGTPLDAIWAVKPAEYAQLRSLAPASGVAFAMLSVL